MKSNNECRIIVSCGSELKEAILSSKNNFCSFLSRLGVKFLIGVLSGDDCFVLDDSVLEIIEAGISKFSIVDIMKMLEGS